MVKSGQAIVSVPWDARRPGAQIEVLRLSDLVARVPVGRVERIEFHLFVLYTAGRSTHEVDFEKHACPRGTLVHIAPTQVLRWGLDRHVDGYALVFTPLFLFPGRTRAGAFWSERFFEDVDWPAAVSLSKNDLAATLSWFRTLEETAHRTDESPLSDALLRHLVSAALLDVARRLDLTTRSKKESAEERARARTFRADVDRSFRVTRNVNDYAQRQRCSPKTLDRACRLAFGMSAKSYVDARVVLEARRLLAHTTLTVAEIAHDLGFSEATNFVKFMKARSGRPPGAFRASEDQAVTS